MTPHPEYLRSPNPKQLYRSRAHSVLGGVCGGIGERYGWDITLVRVLAVLAFFLFAGPLIIIAYMVAWVVIPRRPLDARTLSPEEDSFWRGVSDRPRATFGQLKYTFMDLDERLRNIERKVTSDEWKLRKEFRDLERGN